LKLKKLDNLYERDGLIYPTVGSLWCECDKNDGGFTNYNDAKLGWYDAYKKYTEALAAKNQTSGTPQKMIDLYEEGNKIYD